MIRVCLLMISVLAISLVIAAPAALGLQDLRSRDARDAAAASRISTASRADPRSPDARDAAAGRPTSSTVVEIVRMPARPNGFDWGDAVIGAGTAVGLMLVGVGATGAVSRRRRDASRAALA